MPLAAARTDGRNTKAKLAINAYPSICAGTQGTQGTDYSRAEELESLEALESLVQNFRCISYLSE